MNVQEIDRDMARLHAILDLMSRETGPLITLHMQARKQLLRSGVSSSSLNGGSSYHGSPRGAISGSPSRISAVASSSMNHSPRSNAVNPFTGIHKGDSPRIANNTNGVAVAVQRTKLGAVHGSTATALDLSNDDLVLLRLLCHRADHVASKYLKESCKLPKAREETLSEKAKRMMTIF